MTDKRIVLSWFSSLPDGMWTDLPYSSLTGNGLGCFIEDKIPLKWSEKKTSGFPVIKHKDFFIAVSGLEEIREHQAGSDDDEAVCEEKDLFSPFFQHEEPTFSIEIKEIPTHWHWESDKMTYDFWETECQVYQSLLLATLTNPPFPLPLATLILNYLAARIFLDDDNVFLDKHRHAWFNWKKCHTLGRLQLSDPSMPTMILEWNGTHSQVLVPVSKVVEWRNYREGAPPFWQACNITFLY